MTKIIAIAWLRKGDWPRWQKIDAELPDYDRWLQKIDSAIARVEAGGTTRAVKVVVDPDVFSIWCNAFNKPIDRNSRAQYAGSQLLLRHKAVRQNER